MQQKGAIPFLFVSRFHQNSNSDHNNNKNRRRRLVGSTSTLFGVVSMTYLADGSVL
jgi:hypothetical protein